MSLSVYQSVGHISLSARQSLDCWSVSLSDESASPSVCLSISNSALWSVSPAVCLSVSLCQSISLLVHWFQSIILSGNRVCQCISLFVHQSVSPLVYQSMGQSEEFLNRVPMLMISVLLGQKVNTLLKLSCVFVA